MTHHLAWTIIGAVMRPQWVGLLVGLWAALLGAAAAAQEGASSGAYVYTPPRVVAEVDSAGGPVDRVMRLFADREVPRAEVVGRVKRLAELCGSEVSDLQVSYAPFRSLWESSKDSAKSKPVRQAMVQFGLGGLMDWKRGTVAVEPFARAFRGDLPVRIVYRVGAEFPFRGPAEDAFNLDGVGVRHFAGATSHTYDLSLGAITLPEAAGAVRGGRARTARGWNGVLTGLAIAIGATVLVLVFLVVRMVRLRAPLGAGAAAPDMERLAQKCADPGPAERAGESHTQRG